MPSLRQLEYLVALSQERHFRRAAEKLGVSQPTLSAQVRSLEERLGLELVERGHHTVMITPAGQEIIDIARRMLRDRQAILECANAAREPLGSVVRIGLPPTIGPHLLPLILPELHRAYPNLTLLVREDVPRNLPVALTNGGHDLLVAPLPLRGEDLVSQPIFREPLFVVMAEDHPLAAHKRLTRTDLRGQRVLTLEQGHQLQEQVSAICDEFGAELALDLAGTSLDTLSQMTAMGAGITFLPGLFVERTLRGQTGIVVRSLADRTLYRTIGAAWRKSSPREADFDILIGFVRAAVRRHYPNFMLIP